ncbi:MAG: hypothetical protein WA958_07930 [Tunicatimonas sp.]
MNMKTVYKSSFVEDIYDEAQSLVLSRWFNAVELTNSIYRREMIKHTEVVEQYRPQLMLVNTADWVNFAIDPEVQEWASTEIFGRLRLAGVKKMAFVISPDIITQMSIEQQAEVTKEKQRMNTQEVLGSFTSEQDALAWLGVSQEVAI